MRAIANESGSFRRECLIQVVNQVFCCFQADGQPYHVVFSAGAGALLDERRVGDNPLLWADPTPPPRPSRRRAARPAWMPEVAHELVSPGGDGDGAVEDDDEEEEAATPPPRR